MKPILAIDPGQAGGWALRLADGYTIASPMPPGMTEQVDKLRELAVANPGMVAFIERTGTYRPGMSAPALCTFARHCGHLEAACYSFGVPVVQPAPGVWQQALGTLPKDKAERKRAIKEHVARRFPHLTVTLKTADALGILVWAIQQEGPR